MKIDVAHYTCRGGHSINEDSYFVGGSVFAVADGLGGHANGEEASACAIKYIQENCTRGFDDQKILEILNGANQAVLDLNSPARTTIAAAFVERDEFRYANVGDSRVYYFRNGKLFAQTKDHSVCQALVDMGTLSAEEIRSSEDRSRLLKVLGNEKELNLKKTYPPITIQEGDAFLICSDGFWEFVYEREMEEDLKRAKSTKQWMDDMLKRQLDRAKNEDDNYTVICGRFCADGGAGGKKTGVMAVAVLLLAAVLAAGGISYAYLKNRAAGEGGESVDVSGNAVLSSEDGTGSESMEEASEGNVLDGGDGIKSESAEAPESNVSDSEDGTEAESVDVSGNNVLSSEDGTESESMEAPESNGVDKEDGTEGESKEASGHNIFDGQSEAESENREGITFFPNK